MCCRLSCIDRSMIEFLAKLSVIGSTEEATDLMLAFAKNGLCRWERSSAIFEAFLRISSTLLFDFINFSN